MNSEVIPPSMLRCLTCLLCGLGAGAVVLAGQIPGRSLAPDVVFQLAVLALLLGSRRWMIRLVSLNDFSRLALIVTLFVLPFGIGWLRRSDALHLMLADPLRNLPLELQLLQGFSSAGLALAIFATSARHLCLAGVTSLFTVLFAASVQERDSMLPWLVVVYAGGATAWLLLWHWSRLKDQAGNSAAGVPWVALLSVALVVGVVAGASALDSARMRRTLAQWLSSSGGSGDYHANATSGVGDGEDEAAGSNPDSVGFAMSDVFLEDDGPSLYDVLSEFYGKPHKIKDRQRMIALGLEKILFREKHPVENLRAAREFPMQRQAPTDPRDASGEKTTALLFVQGRTPLHLALTAYDGYDGASLHAAPYSAAGVCLSWDAETRWFDAMRPRREVFRGELESHTVKLAMLNETHLPTPPHFQSLRMGKVTQPEFFAWAQEDILRLAERKPPRGSVLVYRSMVLDSALLRGYAFDPDVLATRKKQASQQTPPALAALSEEWVREAPPGWAQVEAIVARLRLDYQHDNEARTSSTDALTHFLFHSRRGPDYLFATSAALLLRAQGFETRVVSGLYARPERFDAVTGHTPVLRDDVHFWTEVRIPTGGWIAIEPTPGYEMLQPAPNWFDRVSLLIARWTRWMTRNSIPIGVFILAASTGVYFRHRLLDACHRLRWTFRRGLSEPALILATFRLLEVRAAWMRCPRPTALTPGSWAEHIGTADTCFWQLATLADIAAYAPRERSFASSRQEVETLCLKALQTWNLSAFRKLAARRSRE